MATAKKTVKKAAKKGADDVWTAEERAAMKQIVKERKAGKNKAEGEQAALDAIAEMEPSDRAIAERVHAIVKANAPTLSAKTWYGFPAYANDDGVVCFFQPAAKFKTRYATLGFSDKAKLDEGNMWPGSFALKELTPAEEARITALVKKAVG